MKLAGSESVKSILYTGAFRFPDGDAAAFRVKSIAQVLEAEGHVVTFAGWESGENGKPYLYDGHRCYPQAEFRETDLNPFARLAGFLLRGRHTLNWLTKNRKFDLVIAYNPPALFSLLLLLLGKLYGFKVALDSTEWYDSDHLPGGKYGPAAVENWVRMRVSYHFFRNVIAISSYLGRIFNRQNVVLIPPLLTIGRVDGAPREISGVVRVVYAGDAGKKDRLISFIEAIPAVTQRLGCMIELHIAGIKPEALDQVLDSAAVSAEARIAIVCHGRVTRSQVMELYSNSHFSVLFRENARYAWAGFPTKAVESWSSGCPIITNAVGDLQRIARHLKNAIVVDEGRLVEELTAALEEILAGRKYGEMVDESLATAAREFAPDRYRTAVSRFILKL